MKQNMIIYRDSLLPRSETFIRNQALALHTYKPYFMGYKKVANGLLLPDNETFVNNDNENVRNTPLEVLQKSLGFNLKFNRFIKKTHPQFIHAHFGPDGYIALPYAKRFKLPLFVTYHGYDATQSDEYLLKQSYNVRLYVNNKEKLLAYEQAYFIAVSDFIKEKLVNQGFPSSRIFTHYVGLNMDQLTVDPAIQRKPAVLFVGRLVENKGCQYLIEASKQLLQNHPETEIWIVGDGPERKKLEAAAAAISSNIVFFGAQPHEKVIELMNKAKVFCVPSVEIKSGASEGFGIVFAEANAMGVPVVSFRTGGIPEAVQNGQTALLAEQGDVKELSKHLMALFNDDELWSKLSVEGSKFARENFDIKKQTVKLEEIYADVLKCSK